MARNSKAKAVCKRNNTKKNESIAELEAGISPEARRLLEEIREIRRSIGPVKTDAGDILYQLSEKDG